jgi:hypothetical protein
MGLWEMEGNQKGKLGKQVKKAFEKEDIGIHVECK